MKALFFFLTLSFSLHGVLFGQPYYAGDYPLPIPNSPQPLSPLRSLQDARLQDLLNQQIRSKPEWRRLVQQKKMAVGLVDLSNPQMGRFAQLNGNQMMYAASLPKIAILLTAMDAMEKQELEDSPLIQEDLRLMISRSDNLASTRMIDRLGYDKIEAVMTHPRYQLYDRRYGGGLWVGKRYASQGTRHPDPIMGLSHAATASQVCRFYYLMVNGQLVSRERSQQMLDIMEDPALHHKFVNTLDQIAPEARLFRKSGSWQQYHSDSILVWGPQRKYILVGLVEDANGEQILRELVFSAEKVLRQFHTNRF